MMGVKRTALVLGASCLVLMALALVGSAEEINSLPTGVEDPVMTDLLLGTSEKKLLASDGGRSDCFGWTVAAADDVVVAGAYQNDALAADAGAAYVFERNEGGSNAWGQVKKLTASDGGFGNCFGYAVAAASDVVVVGAVHDDDLGGASGSAYVFERNEGGSNAWGQVKKLLAADGAEGDAFGSKIAAAIDMVVVGASCNGERGALSGSVYLFERNAGGSNAWGQVKKLTASDGAAYDRFGYAVAAASDMVVVGSPADDDVADDSGSVYVFERNAGGSNAWGLVKKLTAFDPAMNDRFGSGVAVEGGVIVVGTPGDDDVASSSGSAYLFERNEGGSNAWGLVKKLRASDGAMANEFGTSVAAAGDAVAVGAPHASSGGGAVYVFERHAGGSNAWGQVKKVSTSDGANGDSFGYAVAVSGDMLVGGAYADDDLGTESGSAYVIEGLGAPVIGILASNGAAIASGEAANTSKGTTFGSFAWSQTRTNWFAVTNTGTLVLSITSVAINGTGAEAFQVIGMPSGVAAGTASNFALAFSPPAFQTYTCVVAIANNSDQTPYNLCLSGEGAKRNQTISFDSIPDQLETNTVGLSATASSGLDVAFTVANGPAIINGGTNLLFLGPGMVSVVASQEGNGDWHPAPAVTNTFRVCRIYTLTIQSACGMTTPLTGSYTHVEGVVLTNTAVEPGQSGGTQVVCKGWAMTGNSPQIGTTTNFSMTVTNDAVLTWLWGTNFLLQVQADGTGSTDVTNAWLASGTSVTVTASAGDGYHFSAWTGNTNGCTIAGNQVAIVMDQPRQIVANFITNVLTVITDQTSISVPEGGTAQFQVKLSAQPTGDTVVSVVRSAGDTGITVSGGSSLTFSTANWNSYQTVTLAAAEDNDDNLAGEATITCSSAGIPDAVVTATEADDDYTLNVTAINGTVDKTPNAALYDSGTSVSLQAIQNAGYHFAGWSGAAAGTNNPVTMAMSNNVSVTANFVLNAITVLTDRASISIPEGGTTNFQVKLSAQPTGDAVIAVGRTAGDADIGVSVGSSLTFSPANWESYQTATLAAAEDNGDNQNGTATITCSAAGISNAVLDAIEIDDDYTLSVNSRYGTVIRNPDTPYYESGIEVILTAMPNSAFMFKDWTGDLTGTTNPASIIMDGNKSVAANYAPKAPVVLPPAKIAKNNFVARWKWAEGGSPEGELSVTLPHDGYVFYVPGYEARYVVNSSECLVNNLVAGKVYSYRVRLVMPDGTFSPWSSQMKVRTGSGIPVFKHLLSDVPVAKGLSQEFAISSLVTGAGTLAVKSSNINAVKATVSAGVLKLQYLWNSGNTAKVTMTLTHPATGYKASYGASLSRAGGSVAVVRKSGLINAGTRVAQDLTLENRTSGMVYGVRVRAKGLDNTAWLINRTGLDPVSKAAIREIPCVLPAGSQMVVRLVYNIAYKTQAKTRPVAYGAWAVMTPVNGAMPVTGEMDIGQPDMYDGLWLLGLPANRNRLYRVYHSDDDGANWTLNAPVIRATANYLMWLDTDEGAPAGRLYRVVDAGM